MEKETEKQNLGSGSIPGLMIKLAVPTIIAQLVNLLYNLVDRIYIGHIREVGDIALTGLGLCFPVLMMVTAFAMLIGSGGAPRAAIYMGKGDNETAERILGNSVTSLIVISVVLTIFLEAVAEPILWMFGASEKTLPFALGYMRIYVAGSIFVMMTLGLNMFITTQGFAKISMKTVLIGAICNIILDPLFIFASVINGLLVPTAANASFPTS
jgi:Na+-driven multidrug efflux pump